MMADKQLGKRLKALRKARGKKRGEVAKALGINYSTITNHENSGLGIRHHIERYAAYYGVSVETLLGDELSPGEMRRDETKDVGDHKLFDRRADAIEHAYHLIADVFDVPLEAIHVSVELVPGRVIVDLRSTIQSGGRRNPPR
jgi:transcriptional regulator with XRE-family HTH domain